MGLLDQLLREALAGAGESEATVAPQSASLLEGVLAQLLPLVIDRLTPQGQVPKQDLLQDLGRRLLGSSAAQEEVHPWPVTSPSPISRT